MESITQRLLDSLLAEFTARDPAFFQRVALTVTPQELALRLVQRIPEMEQTDAVQRKAAIDYLCHHFAFDSESAHASERFDDLLLDSVADALLASDGRLHLETRNADEEKLSFADRLSRDFVCYETDSGRVFVSRRAGTPLVLISALGIPAAVWTQLIACPEGWQLILPELSCGSLAEGGMATAQSVQQHADTIQHMLSALELTQRPWLMGWCNGGRIALELSSRMAQWAGGLILLCPTLREPADVMAASPNRPSRSTYEDKLQQLFTLIAANPESAASVAMMIGKLLAPPDWQKVAPEHYFSTLFGQPGLRWAGDLSTPMQTAPALLNYARRTQLDEVFASGRSWQSLCAPVFLIQGDDDPVVSNADTTWWLQQHLPAFTSYHLSGAGHMPQGLQFRYLSWVLRHIRAGSDSAESTPRRVRIVHFCAEQ
ncbi:alpha/beta hydrolase [Salmonella enterica subsp. enterica]|nr:alpha/beta hydrolase [Salmonella enterica]EBQ9479963.1 alpha/beta hydrolase [Salmonella enterica subsp. enterica serovar Kokomlemle]ECS5198536.1 alpha/beta hydrolase [Salmonella enterica subsp. enterica serovar Poano]EBJ7122028.1 alpha/beta hydrolase [Salmonella enterica]ECX4750925.1 alpha/beta hydrolase [Salmonella enterica]